jgi:glycosyltransferase involved in cell wall biosynthesis
MKDTLLILTPGFPANEADTTCLPPQQVFVRALKKNYPQLDILVLSFRYPYHTTGYEWNGITVIPFGGKNKKGFSRLLLWHRINKKLRAINSRKNIIGILSFWYGECALAGKKFAARYNHQHLCWILGQDAKKNNRYVQRTRPEPGELVALSDFIAGEFEKNHGARPQHIIPPGIDTSLFSDHLPVKDIDIMGTGSLIPLKQYAVFLEAIAGIKKQLPHIKALLAGDGPEKKKLVSLAKQYCLEENIVFTGALPHTRVLELMQRTKVFLHPSRYEGFGVVCIEALQAGAAVISFCRPMKKEIPDWHFVHSKEEMTTAALSLLKKNEKVPGSTTPFLITDSVNAMMQLFGYKEATTS